MSGPYRPIASWRPAFAGLWYRYVPGAAAVNVNVPVPPAATVAAPWATAMPGISNPTASASVLRSVTVTVSPSLTVSVGPGSPAVTAAQLPPEASANPHTGAVTAPGSATVPAL